MTSTIKSERQKIEYTTTPGAEQCMLVNGEFYGVAANTRYKRVECGRWLRELNGRWVSVRAECVPQSLKSAFNAMAQIVLSPSRPAKRTPPRPKSSGKRPGLRV